MAAKAGAAVGRRLPALLRPGTGRPPRVGTGWISLVLVVCGLMAFGVVEQAARWAGLPTWAGLVGSLLGALGVWAAVFGWRGWVRRRLRESDGLICPECGYRLNGLSARGECPECGGAYEHDLIRDRWRFHYGPWD